MNSVGSKSAFQRSFFIFTNEDTGFEAGQKPSGHVKVEVRGARGKLHAVAQNMRPGNGRFEYILYILRSGANAVEPIRAGRMENKLNRWELECTFDPTMLGMSGYSAVDYDVIAILVEFPDRQKSDVICPLAAYRNKPVEWRKSFRQAEPPAEALSVVHSNKSEAGVRTEGEAAIEAEKECRDRDSAAIEAENECGDRDSAAIEAENECGDRDSVAIDTETGCGSTDEAVVKTENEGAEMSSFENTVDRVDKVDEAELGAEGVTEAVTNSDYYDDARKAKEDVFADKGIQSNQTQASTNTIDTTCIYLNGNMCAALIQPEAGGANPCGSCKLSHREQPANARLPVDMMRLEEIFDNNFERSDPFESNRSDYSWWKVTNPVNLNNILYLNSIRSPLLFNPAVMVAHYKYRHFIIGIFTHMDGQKYVVCGVPGMHMVDRKPFGQLGTWVQTEGNKLRYGAFGYWLVYINPDDGKMLNLNQNAGF